MFKLNLIFSEVNAKDAINATGRFEYLEDVLPPRRLCSRR